MNAEELNLLKEMTYTHSASRIDLIRKIGIEVMELLDKLHKEDPKIDNGIAMASLFMVIEYKLSKFLKDAQDQVYKN